MLSYLFEVIFVCSNVFYTLQPHCLVVTLTNIHLDTLGHDISHMKLSPPFIPVQTPP